MNRDHYHLLRTRATVIYLIKINLLVAMFIKCSTSVYTKVLFPVDSLSAKINALKNSGTSSIYGIRRTLK